MRSSTAARCGYQMGCGLVYVDGLTKRRAASTARIQAALNARGKRPRKSYSVQASGFSMEKFAATDHRGSGAFLLREKTGRLKLTIWRRLSAGTRSDVDRKDETVTLPLDTMEPKRYRTILADPPWPYKSPGQFGNTLEHRPNRDSGMAKYGSGSKQRYGSIAMSDLLAMPIRRVVDANAHLYLWTTNTFVCEAHELAVAWGFKPNTLLTWGKVKADGSPSMKMGYYFRGATEHILFSVRGKLRVAGQAKPTLFLSPRLPHSVKPDWIYSLAEECSPGPRLELFARRKRPKWDSWGNEVESDIVLTVMGQD